MKLGNNSCQVDLIFKGYDRIERRDKALALFTDYRSELRESNIFAAVSFPVLDKGRKDVENWEEVREKLVNMGTILYETIRDSDI